MTDRKRYDPETEAAHARLNKEIFGKEATRPAEAHAANFYANGPVGAVEKENLPPFSGASDDRIYVGLGVKPGNPVGASGEGAYANISRNQEPLSEGFRSPGGIIIPDGDLKARQEPPRNLRLRIGQEAANAREQYTFQANMASSLAERSIRLNRLGQLLDRNPEVSEILSLIDDLGVLHLLSR